MVYIGFAYNTRVVNHVLYNILVLYNNKNCNDIKNGSNFSQVYGNSYPCLTIFLKELEQDVNSGLSKMMNLINRSRVVRF